MQDQPQAGDARDDSDVQLEFYEQLARDDQEVLGEAMGNLENSTGIDSTFGESIGDITTDKAADPFMTDAPEEDLS